MIPNPLWVGPWVLRFLRPEDQLTPENKMLQYRYTSYGIEEHHIYGEIIPNPYHMRFYEFPHRDGYNIFSILKT